jgi:hypothetical protein
MSYSLLPTTKLMTKDNINEGPTGQDLLKGIEEAFAGKLSDDEGPEYSTHKDQIAAASPSLERTDYVLSSMLEQFKDAIIYREVPFIQFSEMTAQELAAAFFNAPVIIKPTLSCVNVAQRAIRRDLGFDFDTYAVKITREIASIIAGYVKPLLPPVIAIPALIELDRYFWTDKEMRAKKGNWERTITEAINQISTNQFKKCKFELDAESFELDAAFQENNLIDVAIDVKRIESTRDTHKRADEIINKAAKFKRKYPLGRFYAVVYFPFPTQHINLQSRLKSEHIDEVFFAAETPSSIANTVDMLVGVIGSKKKQ